MRSIILKPKKEDSVLRFHPWIFSGAIKNLPEDIVEGEMVKVVSSDGTTLGVGHYQEGSIAVRILDFNASSLPEDFFLERISKAFRLRQELGLKSENNNSYRLVHGEGDFLPGLIIDIYNDTAVMQAHSLGMHNSRFVIADSLTRLPGASIRNVYYKSETTLPFLPKMEQQNEYLIGKFDGNLAMENGLLFNIDWLKGQKTGFFLDQRDNRLLLEKYAHDKSVLNMFCYTGGFSVYALRGGANKVVSVDSSSKAIELTDSNISLNFKDNKNHVSIATDAFRYLNDIEKDEFDLIILDPPAFAKHRGAIKNGLIGYRRLNSKAFEKIRSGGILFTFSCSQAITKDMFRLAVMTAAVQSGRKVRILHQLTQPADHPVNIYHPEGEYLKGLVLYVE